MLSLPSTQNLDGTLLFHSLASVLALALNSNSSLTYSACKIQVYVYVLIAIIKIDYMIPTTQQLKPSFRSETDPISFLFCTY